MSLVSCGARIIHPVCPLQPSKSRPASLDIWYGEPPFPKIDSTKSRFETSDPGAKNLTSILFFEVTPSTAGLTSGLSSSDTKICAFLVQSSVNGRLKRSPSIVVAFLRSNAAVLSGTAFLSSGIGIPPSAIWNTPFVVRLSLRGLCSTPCLIRYEVRYSDAYSSLFSGSESSLAIP